jgi:hypothetical protein
MEVKLAEPVWSLLEPYRAALAGHSADTLAPGI